jgi:hypothetical protein
VEGIVPDIDAYRARWFRYRQRLKLTDDVGDEFACGGLARFADELEVRLVCLPSDPEADVVPLNDQTLDRRSAVLRRYSRCCGVKAQVRLLRPGGNGGNS